MSRIIDVIEQSGGSVLSADATGVTGCSRYGKGAFVAGAFDQRIALTMPVESGSGGLAAFRAIPGESGAQPLSSAYGEQPWLGDAFGSFTGNPARLPVDTHSTVAMIAPRGLLMMDNPHIDWLAARSASVGALGGAEVYKALGAEGNITYWSDVQDGNHCASRSEWRGPIQQSIQKFLRNSGSYTGSMRISPAKRGDLAEWRDWQTPDLSGSNPGDTTPPTAPTGLTASGTTATGTSLSWTASTDDTGVTGYDILRAPATGAFTQAGTSATTSYSDTGLTPETAYRYQVRARDAAGNTSAVSNTVQITTEPGSPSGGTCTAVQTVQTQWATGYVIQPLTITNTGSATVNGWTVTFTLPAGHTLTGSWNGVVTTSGQTVTIRNVAHNGTLAPGASTGVGFQATRPDGDSALPSGYTCA